MDGPVYEVVLFQLKPGISRDDFLQVTLKATDWLRNQPGFLGREILEDDSGQWIELLRWATMDDAKASAAAIEDTELVAAIMEAVVPDTVRMLHPTRLASYASR